MFIRCSFSPGGSISCLYSSYALTAHKNNVQLNVQLFFLERFLLKIVAKLVSASSFSLTNQNEERVGLMKLILTVTDSSNTERVTMISV